MEQTISNQEQRLQMLNRKKIELTGVTEVISFDTQEVVLDTVGGTAPGWKERIFT